MALAEIGLVPLFQEMPNAFAGAQTSRSIAAATHWVGGQFYAPSTGTISSVHFRTGTVSSPVLQLEAAITALDASGYPLGTDVAASSTTATNPTANTNYALDISASVTAGTLYGVIVRVKATTYSSGSASVLGEIQGAFIRSAQFLGVPTNSYNIGSNVKNGNLTTIGVEYSTGYEQTIGLSPPWNSTSVATGTSSGNVCGNKFTLTQRIAVIGYKWYGDCNGSMNVEMYSGSDNTAVTGSSVSVNNSYKAITSETGMVQQLASAVILEPGTYRVGIRNTSTTSNVLFEIQVAEAGMGAILAGTHGGTFQKTVYASSAWTDTSTSICAISPILTKIEDGKPWAAYAAGLG